MALEEGDIVMCTVEKIVGTVVFVKIDGDGEGSIVFSEIAPGRIRNIRDYVVPKKVIVCKVLSFDNSGNVHLSLRRVSQKEVKEVKEEYKKEKNSHSILKGVLGEEAEKVIKEILQKEKVYEFLENAKNKPEILERIIGAENSKRILGILNTQKQKKAIIKKEIFLTTTKPNGLVLIKKVLGNVKGIEVKYLSAGRYILKVESDFLKAADNQLREVVAEIEKKAKQEGLEFVFKDK